MQVGISGSHSIFDIVMEMQGVDFEAAKIFVAEAIGRQDLIQQHNPLEKRFPSTDAASLLNPSSEQRNDALALEYLAFRLGVDKDAVPLPTTPFAGWSGLAYFDPPASNRKNAKPVHAGDRPCAVFGTLDSKGNRHAQRIYLAANGQGKADLGEGRNPKKSAKVADGDNISGRCVIWGEPERAPHLIICEGIETAAAVAHVYAAEIASGTVAVLAAISATGIEAFEPWAATQRITVAGDRDEAPKPDGKAGSRRGERAARKLCIRLYERLKCDIALPGHPNEGIDYLDIFRRDGAHAVRESIEAAIRFVPKQSELDELAGAQSRAAELKDIELRFPLPAIDGLHLEYAHTNSGSVMMHTVIRDKNPHTGRHEQIMTPVVSPFSIEARIRHEDKGNEWGLRLVVQDMDGNECRAEITRAQLASRGSFDVMASLYAKGMRFFNDGEKVTLEILKAAKPQKRVIAFNCAAWHTIDDVAEPFFIVPDGTVLGVTDD